MARAAWSRASVIHVAEDLYGIEDEIEEMAEWEPGEEFPVFLPDEEQTWLAKRFLAIRFQNEEVRETEVMYARQVELLQAEIQRLEADRDAHTGTIRRTIRRITGQLTQFHRAAVGRAEMEHRMRTVQAVENDRPLPKLRVPTTVKNPQGTLKSKAGGQLRVKITEGQEAAVVKWLQDNGLEAGLRVKPAVAEQILPDITAMRVLVTRADDGTIQGILSDDGEACPGVTIEETVRDFWLTLPDGTSSKDWADD